MAPCTKTGKRRAKLGRKAGYRPSEKHAEKVLVRHRDGLSSPKERSAVSNDNVVQLIQPVTFQDQLAELLRRDARDLLMQAVEAKVAEFLAGARRRI